MTKKYAAAVAAPHAGDGDCRGSGGQVVEAVGVRERATGGESPMNWHHTFAEMDLEEPPSRLLGDAFRALREGELASFAIKSANPKPDVEGVAIRRAAALVDGGVPYNVVAEADGGTSLVSSLRVESSISSGRGTGALGFHTDQAFFGAAAPDALILATVTAAPPFPEIAPLADVKSRLTRGTRLDLAQPEFLVRPPLAWPKALAKRVPILYDDGCTIRAALYAQRQSPLTDRARLAVAELASAAEAAAYRPPVSDLTFMSNRAALHRRGEIVDRVSAATRHGQRVLLKFGRRTEVLQTLVRGGVPVSAVLPRRSP